MSRPLASRQNRTHGSSVSFETAIDLPESRLLIAPSTIPPAANWNQAVSSLFVGASNELGEFESGLAARILGPVGAAVFGGAGAMIVTGLWAKLFPDLRRADRLV